MQIDKYGNLLEQKDLQLGFVVILQREFLCKSCQDIPFQDITLLHLNPSITINEYNISNSLTPKIDKEWEYLVDYIQSADMVLFIENVDGKNECKVLKNKFGVKGFIQ